MPAAVTLVAATRDRPAVLGAALARWRATDPEAPVVVVDDGSRRPVAAALAADDPGVMVLSTTPPRGACAARNAGMRAARTPLVALVDDDAWWAPGALDRAVARLVREPGIGLLAAHVLVGTAERPDPTVAAMATGRPGPHGDDHDVRGFVACGVVARRAALLACGGFPARYGTGGEEAAVALGMRAHGWAVRYAPDVVVHHHPPADRDPVARRRRRITTARNDLWTAWRHRRARSALATTATAAGRATHDAEARAALVSALRGAPRELRGRRPVTPALERRLREG